MADPKQPIHHEPPEIIYVEERRIACDGGGGVLGHPRVFLTIGDREMVECGYCDRMYVLRPSAPAPGEH